MNKEYKLKLIEVADEVYRLMTEDSVYVGLSQEDFDKKVAQKEAFINNKIMYLLGFISGLKDGDH